MSDIQGHAQVRMGSARGFGLVMAGALLILSLWPLATGGSVLWWLAAIALCFAGLAIFAPGLLAPLNKIWFRFGLLLGAVTAPVVMALLFFLVITPTGLIMRALGKDPLRQKSGRSAVTHWIKRRESVGSMKRQF